MPKPLPRVQTHLRLLRQPTDAPRLPQVRHAMQRAVGHHYLDVFCLDYEGDLVTVVLYEPPLGFHRLPVIIEYDGYRSLSEAMERVYDCYTHYQPEVWLHLLRRDAKMAAVPLKRFDGGQVPDFITNHGGYQKHSSFTSAHRS